MLFKIKIVVRNVSAAKYVFLSYNWSSFEVITVILFTKSMQEKYQHAVDLKEVNHG